MTEIVVPVTTIWDVIANALNDTGFWILSAAGMFVIAFLIRNRIKKRWTACPCRL